MNVIPFDVRCLALSTWWSLTRVILTHSTTLTCSSNHVYFIQAKQVTIFQIRHSLWPDTISLAVFSELMAWRCICKDFFVPWRPFYMNRQNLNDDMWLFAGAFVVRGGGNNSQGIGDVKWEIGIQTATDVVISKILSKRHFLWKTSLQNAGAVIFACSQTSHTGVLSVGCHGVSKQG